MLMKVENISHTRFSTLQGLYVTNNNPGPKHSDKMSLQNNTLVAISRDQFASILPVDCVTDRRAQSKWRGISWKLNNWHF
jgi:hypothetical protein